MRWFRCGFTTVERRSGIENQEGDLRSQSNALKLVRQEAETALRDFVKTLELQGEVALDSLTESEL